MNNKVILLFFPRVNADNTRFMPFSVLHLERMARGKGHTVIIVDEQTNTHYENLIEKYKESIFLAAVTSTTGYQLKGAIAFSEKIKKLAPQAYTVWCGWHTSILPELTLKENYVDFVISGQAEISFEMLLTALTEDTSFNDIKGLGYKTSDQLFFNPQGEFQDINTFPEIDLSLVNPNDYIFTNSFSKRCLTYFASHGCPYKCEFCSFATVFQGKWYHKSISQIIKDISYLKNKAHLDGISFWDDNFFTNKTFSLELAQAFIDNNLNIKWECCTHAGLFNKLFDESDVALFYKSGLRQIFIGAESGDEEILKRINKHINVEDNYTFVKKIKKFNIAPVFLIMTAFPINPDKDLKASLNMIRKAKIINKKLKTRLHIFIPVPKTKMYDFALERGMTIPNKLNDYIYLLYNFKLPWIKKDYSWQLETFINFYLPLANPCLYKEAPTALLKIFTALLSLFFFPFTYLRFKFNFFHWPIEACFFLYVLRIFNKIFKTKLTLGSESYLDKNSLGFYNSYCS